MILISHRGNINGKKNHLENNPDYVDKTILMGYNVEIDVRLIDGTFFLGHDDPQFQIELDWLLKRRPNLWIHAKNIECLNFFSKFTNNKYNFFWHQEDNYTLTSNLMIWTYPDQTLSERSIAVMPENTNYTIEDLSKCTGICSDFIERYKDLR
jgi:hypothetical protein